MFRSKLAFLLFPALALFAGPATAATESIVFGMGCFWGAEKRMSQVEGVRNVEAGYAGGDAEKVDYRDVLTTERAIRRGDTDQRNHAEVVKVTYDPSETTLERVLAAFWQNHDPTQANRQGNDVGSNYRSAIYTTDSSQRRVAERTREVYQRALTAAGFGRITTEIAPLRHYNRAEEYHQNYLEKNPNGYCGIGGTGVDYPGSDESSAANHPRLDAADLNKDRQLVVFESELCPFCEQFKQDVLSEWRSDVPVARTDHPRPPEGWTLAKALFATPTIVLFEDGREVARYTGYQGDEKRFWQWLGQQTLTEEQRRIAFEQGTERAFSGSHLDETRPGTFVDPITGAALFRSDSKFKSQSGWPSFFQPVEGAITLHEDDSHGMTRTEVRSASSGIHLGHVFHDGPPPTGKRFCINGDVLRFVPDEAETGSGD